MKLTKTQIKAIEHAGENLQLIACAGSGKTEVVSRRVVHLLRPSGHSSLKPRNIVAFTFTEKSAAELKERIVTRFNEAFEEVYGLAEMFIGTIHSFCLELLKTEAPKYLKYSVLNEVQQKLFIDRNSQQSGLTTSTDLSGTLLRRYVDTSIYIEALSILREDNLVKTKLRDCSITSGLVDYRNILEEHSYLDYSSILESAAKGIEKDSSVRKSLAERVKYIIVDEYQDLNPIQETIVRLLYDLGANICVVGDDDQAIYQWRGSDINNILTFQNRYPKVDQISLEENYRSSVGIIETARTFIEQNVNRLPKLMQPTEAQKYESGDIVALAFNSAQEEAGYIATTIKSLYGTKLH